MKRADEITLTRAVAYALAALLFAGMMTHCTAEAQVLPADEWTPRTHLWLARAFVAEAGWEGERDHAAIAWVLERRWKRAKKRWQTLRFIDVVRAYCAGLGDWKPRVTRRQQWVRELAFDLDEPEHWPRKADWGEHVGYWQGALNRAWDWQRGRVSDPCRGKSWHWGGTIDSPFGRMVAVDCGDTRNTFYGLSSAGG